MCSEKAIVIFRRVSRTKGEKLQGTGECPKARGERRVERGKRHGRRRELNVMGDMRETRGRGEERERRQIIAFST